MQNPQAILNDVFENLKSKAEKIKEGQKVFQQIKSVDVGISEKELVWTKDKIQLFRYKQKADKLSCLTPIIISYALINRYDMMDLQPDRSLIKKLLEFGLDIYVIDTGYPTKNDRYLTINDYVNRYIHGAVEYVRQAHNIQSVNLLGVCQGGTFAVIYSALHPEKVKNLVTLVTPIDFSTNDGLLMRWARFLDVDTMVESHDGLIPGYVLDVGFQMLKPMLKPRKYKNLMDMMDDEDKVINYLRMEKWINDLPDQAGETYRQFIKDLYQQNKLAKNELVIGQRTVHLKDITMPAMTIYASEDHLVPPNSTKPLHDLIGSKDKKLYEFPGGHIGVFTGQRSQAELGPTIAQWLIERDN